MRGVIARYPLAKPHYVEIVAPDTLEPVSRVAADSVAALAIFVGKTRLIDNMPFDECEDVFAKETLRTRRRAKT
jgi:pantoate--beta-alanine ligase